MKFLLLFVILALGHVSTSCATELGTDLLRTFFVEKAQPFTIAEGKKDFPSLSQFDSKF